MTTLTAENIAFERAHWEDDRGPLVAIVTTVFIGQSLLTVILRLVTRKVILKRSWQVDDYAIVLAMILASGYYAAALLSTNHRSQPLMKADRAAGVHYGSGKHVIRVGIDHTIKIASIVPALELNYTYCHLAIKLSLLFQYRALFTLQNTWFRFAWYIIGAYIIAVTISSTVVTLVQCQPFHYLWDQIFGKTHGHCIQRGAALLGLAVLTIVADVALLVLPIPTLVGLHLPSKQKFGLCLIFCLGTVACAASAVRIFYAASPEGYSEDTTYTQVNLLNWSMIEPCVGISCACLATLRPLFRLLREHSKLSKMPKFALQGILRPGRQEPKAITDRFNSDSPDTHSGAWWFGTCTIKGSREIEMRNLGGQLN